LLLGPGIELAKLEHGLFTLSPLNHQPTFYCFVLPTQPIYGIQTLKVNFGHFEGPYLNGLVFSSQFMKSSLRIIKLSPQLHHIRTGSFLQQKIYIYTSQPGPGAAREKFDELTSLIWTF